MFRLVLAIFTVICGKIGVYLLWLLSLFCMLGGHIENLLADIGITTMTLVLYIANLDHDIEFKKRKALLVEYGGFQAGNFFCY